ncbi:TlpA disulfide reductase family protein [Sulfurimonas sp.]|uniref:TlpA family protein disulfide reductase n=1 Tax=Sulfurimonas sp. TaxID=2022749 RepID=UPI0026290DE8|nr:TlpA disulfide reductase family protein [Sulfurimonas sp.]MDD5157443.1 TlpA disulfide reductase family protein [Sulfurimonas sp.]
MFKKTILIISTLSIFLLGGCSKKDDANDMVSKNEFVLTGLDKKEYVVKQQGSGFVLDGAKGKIVIFDIFATWCPPCQDTASHLTSLQEKFKNDVIIIGLTIEDKVANSKLTEFATKNHAKYILVNSDQNRRLSDAIVNELKLGERYPIPLMVLYKDGKLVNHFVGVTEEEFIESEIKNALGK